MNYADDRDIQPGDQVRHVASNATATFIEWDIDTDYVWVAVTGPIAEDVPWQWPAEDVERIR